MKNQTNVMLSKNQQRKIMGGNKQEITCACTGETNKNSTYACITFNQAGTLDCYNKAADYCDGSFQCKSQTTSVA